MNRKDELTAIKLIPMVHVLKNLGVILEKHGTNVMFKAIWRNERKASVSIRSTASGFWCFVDHGSGTKGSNIDLVMLISRWSYPETVKWLRDTIKANDIFFSKAANVIFSMLGNS